MLREGRPLRSGRVVVYLAPGDGPARATFVAGRKVGKATARNRARRLLREAWRELTPVVRTGLDVVLVARAAIRGARLGQVKAEIEELFRRAEAIQG